MRYVKEIALIIGMVAFALLSNYAAASLGNPQSLWVMKMLGLM